jgi:hypothetical protein
LEIVEDDFEGEDEQPIQSSIINDDNEFQELYGWIELGIQVAKETGVSYFDVEDKPCIHVLSLATYLIDKCKKVQRDFKKNSK